MPADAPGGLERGELKPATEEWAGDPIPRDCLLAGEERRPCEECSESDDKRSASETFWNGSAMGRRETGLGYSRSGE